MRLPYLIGIWQSSILDCTTFVSKHMLGDNVVQIVEDKPNGYWLMLRVTADQGDAIREAGNLLRPRMNVIP